MVLCLRTPVAVIIFRRFRRSAIHMTNDDPSYDDSARVALKSKRVLKIFYPGSIRIRIARFLKKSREFGISATWKPMNCNVWVCTFSERHMQLDLYALHCENNKGG